MVILEKAGPLIQNECVLIRRDRHNTHRGESYVKTRHTEERRLYDDGGRLELCSYNLRKAED